MATKKVTAFRHYFRELKAEGLNPDILAQQKGKNNPHKQKHMEANDKFLGRSSGYDRAGENDIADKSYNEPFYLDVIGTSHCRSRALVCTKKEYEIFSMARGES